MLDILAQVDNFDNSHIYPFTVQCTVHGTLVLNSGDCGTRVNTQTQAIQFPYATLPQNIYSLGNHNFNMVLVDPNAPPGQQIISNPIAFQWDLSK